MVSKSVIFLGSKPVGYECLAWLIQQQDAMNFEITGVLTQARKEFGGVSDLNELATENAIPVYTDPDTMPECDILYSVQYHKILKKEHIDKARLMAVNLHMAPLPEYRGSNQFSFAIIDEKKEFGTTIHKIDPRIDHGDILFQHRFPIPDNCWVGDLYNQTVDISVSLFKATLPRLLHEDCKAIPQEILIAKYGTSLHYRNEMDSLKIIDLDWDKEKTERYIRATSMPGFEPPYCIIDGRKIYFSTKH